MSNTTASEASLLQVLQDANATPLWLGSSSSARKAVLLQRAIPFRTIRPDIDEKRVGVEERTLTQDAPGLTLKVAHAKADAILSGLLPSSSQNPSAAALADSLRQPDSVVLLVTCDQVTLFQGQIREKPESKSQAQLYLSSYSPSAPVETVSALVVTNVRSGARVDGIDRARQFFNPIPSPVIAQLIDQGDVMHCCGGFMIDNPLIYPYLLKREGSEDSILGLPMMLLERLVRQQLDLLLTSPTAIPDV